MAEVALSTSFQNADSSDINFLTKFLEDANRLPSIAASFKKQLELLDLEPGQTVLDVGCGIGDRAAEMAEIVGSTGKVCGTDLSGLMVDVSRRRNEGNGLSLEFYVASAVEQPFPDNSFDCVRTERVLMYLPDSWTGDR
jgi:ubiquinone/menaquinone biosynthesis C-methylase UbiE